MKKFLKENIVLVLGLSLPIALVIVFTLANILPKFFIADPQYDFLFSDGSPSNVVFDVVNQKVILKVTPSRFESQLSVPHLYRYIAATGKVQEVNFATPDLSKFLITPTNNNNININNNVVIPIDTTKLHSSKQVQDTTFKIISEINKIPAPVQISPIEFSMAELANLTINSSPISPDDYQITNRYEYSNHGILNLGPSYYDMEPANFLSKNQKKLHIIYNKSSGSYYLKFIGWIIP